MTRRAVPLLAAFLRLLLVSCCIASASAGEPMRVASTRLEVKAGRPAADIVCPARGRRAATPPRPEADPLEVPGEEELTALSALVGPAQGAIEPSAQLSRKAGGPLRVAIWGDSHIAAGFFTEELIRLAGLDAAQARPAILAANFGRAGVRLPLRKACASSEWRYETAYAHAAGAARPGPGLVNMVAGERAELALDLRGARDAQAQPLQLLYDGGDAPLRLAISVDGGAESQVQLQAAPGPAVLEIVPDAPVSQLRVRVLEGTLRLHGLMLGAQPQPQPQPQPQAQLQLDVFGYPGATAAGWRQADPDYLRAWFGADAYDLVMLAYGTNEGNVHAFDAPGYRQTLAAAVANLRETFPAAACVLLGPGDRGVLVRRSQKSKPARKAGGVRGAAARAQPPRDAAALLRYSRIHAEIASIQRGVARSAGCSFWSALDAMGGPGSAYRWNRSGLMAPDLIHFTVRGYQQLAQAFAAATGWTPAMAQPGRTEPASR